MTACVFVGPTLSRDEVLAACDVVCLPPVAQGDVYRAAQRRPHVIGIIDGYFEGVPSVWHKEILWAMSQGIHVFGAASMGALRAAELHAFGMEGVGRIFEAYCDGALEDDDEVAVVHGPAETGYVSLSDAMVNIRATLVRAETEGVIGPATRLLLERFAKGLFYQRRTWEAVLDGAANEGLQTGELDRLKDWLPRARVNQKRDDAIAMLTAMRERQGGSPTPGRVAYSFEWTQMWDDAVASFALRSEPGDASHPVTVERVLDELRLDGDAVRHTQERALARMLGLREAVRQRIEVDRDALVGASNRFRAERGLFTRKDVERWVAENDLDDESFQRLIESETRLAALRSMAKPALSRPLLDDLKITGNYIRLAERAHDKQQVLESTGLEDPQPGKVGPTPAALVAWYFEVRLGRPMPQDIEAFARDLGFTSKGEFYRALLREYLYSTRDRR